jgi:hypothetical protein
MTLSLVLLLACSGKEPADDSGGGGEDTPVDYGPNPIVPDEYVNLWDLDASSCDDADGAIVYHLFSGGTDGAGGFSGSERYYWFFAAEGWEGDCIDTFTVTGTASDTNWQEDPCSGCDYEFTSVWNLHDEDRTCGAFDYEDFFDNDKVDDDKFNTIVMLDPLSPGGNVNESTLVMMAYQDDDNHNSYSFDSSYARGSMLPVVEDDWEGATTVEWAGTTGWCVKITSG